MKIIKIINKRMFKISSIDESKNEPKYWNRKIPKKINIKSDIEQIKQTRKTYCFFKPCSITNIFWAPIAKIKLSPVKKPSIKKLIYFSILWVTNPNSLSLKVLV